jgi:hypothetical protein
MFRRSTLSSLALVAVLVVAPACKKSGGSGSGGAPGGGGGGTAQATAGAQVPAFSEKEIVLDTVKIKAFVPQGWREEIGTGSFARATYQDDRFTSSFEIGVTCSGYCEPAKWAENARTEAGEQLANFATYDPPMKTEVQQNGEVEAGKYVLRYTASPVNPDAGVNATAFLRVWRYGPDWPQIVTCQLQTEPGNATLADAALKACLDVQYLGTAAEAPADAGAPPADGA